MVAVLELPKNAQHVGEADCFHRRSADVRIPSGHGGWEARSCTVIFIVGVCGAPGFLVGMVGGGWW